jgi:DNA-binding NarL/FixJ family response regulator
VPGRILVVDDDPAFRAVARRLLDAHGLQLVGEAGTASDAYAAAVRLEPDGILVDIGLPDENGIVLAHRLASLAWHPRVLLTSTDPDAAGSEPHTREGISGFVPKQDLPDVSLCRLLMRQ